MAVGVLPEVAERELVLQRSPRRGAATPPATEGSRGGTPSRLPHQGTAVSPATSSFEGATPRPRQRRLASFSEVQLRSPDHEVLHVPESESAQMVALTASPRLEPQGERPEVGDIVTLGPAAQPEFSGHRGIVTATADTHVTVAVLDDSGCIGVGECWPSFRDISLKRRDWRLGQRVVVDGLVGERTRKLNGCTGAVARHPRSGHPSFVCKPQAPEEPRLTLCVRLDDPAANAGKASVLVEPRFLQPYGDWVRQISDAASREADGWGGRPP